MANLVPVRLVSVQDRCTVYAKCTIVFEIILDEADGTQVMWLKWKFVSVCLEIVLMLTQDRCTVCAEHTKGTEIILYAVDGTPR
jgi:hypothetical protein